MSPKIKPLSCPFPLCKSEPQIATNSSLTHAMVICQCGAAGPSATNENEAINAWNSAKR